MWTNGQRTKTNPKTSPEQSAIFQLVQEINKTNVLTKKTAPPPWQLYIYKTNLFTKFHDDWAKNVTSRESNVLTKFHENWTKNVTSRMFTCFHYTHIEKNAPPTDGAKIVTSRVLTRKTAQPTGGHLHEDWALNVTSTVLKLDRDIIGTNLLTKFHEDRTMNVASRVFTDKCGRTDDGQRPVTKAQLSKQTDRQTDRRTDETETKVLTTFHENRAKNVTSRENAPPTGGHVFSPIWTIFELVREINKTNVLTNFMMIEQILKTAPPNGGHVLLPIWTIFKLVRDINKTNVLTNFRDD
ncbi:hypothetical protein DPMN_013419 [Dreissena polymorpha]|uniref:Uncharacterized protein n=1 Tax=Dreissena polymorpha TaxID=45954 RepID=A0A9D4S3N5_DREPO|nr:hypothetical protein DPMN_013419 [Dreissena polymorpha]